MKISLLPLCAAGLLVTSPAFAGASGLHILDTISIGGNGGWDYANFDPVARKLFLAHGTSIAAVSVDTKAVTANLADAEGAHIALPLGDGKTVLVTEGKSSKVSFIDTTNGANLGDVPTGAKPDGAILDPASGKVFVLANGGNEIDVVDPTTREAIGKIMLAGAPESGAADGKGLLFTHLEDKNAIVVIDTLKLTVKATYTLKDCEEPSGLALINDQRLLLSACRGGLARVSNADTGAEIATVAIGQRADGAVYDDARKLGYIPSGDGKLTVISFDGAPHVVDVVSTKVGARTAALDPVSGHVYLPTADFATVAKPGDRPQALPNTFEVLVVGK